MDHFEILLAKPVYLPEERTWRGRKPEAAPAHLSVPQALRAAPAESRASPIRPDPAGGEDATQPSLADLDGLEHAAFVCDRSGRVLTANQSARGLVTTLMGEDRRLRFAQDSDNLAFAALLKNALDTSRAGETSAMACELPPPWDNAVLRAMRLRRDRASRADVLVLVEKQRADAADALRRDFGLTGAETRVAVALARGISLEDICAQQGIARATGRSHLKSIFRKTDTRGQVQLAVLVCKLWRCG